MEWKSDLKKILGNHFGKEVNIGNYSYVGGGSINESFKINTSEGNLFVKKNSASRFPQMFIKEASGINILAKASEIKVPVVVTHGESERDAFLVLEFIDSGSMKSNFWQDFAIKLGNLHRHSSDFFGLDHNNYIGSLPQINNKHDSWVDFFRDERLSIQVKMARDSGKMNSTDVKLFNNFYSKLNDLFPIEKPSLVHGDLWSGNFMIDQFGEAVIIDPAVYYGHREMDIAMSMLFGGFNNQFYLNYNNYFPLEEGWEKRIHYCNLYPLMVHVNLFGGGYLNSVRSILKEF